MDDQLRRETLTREILSNTAGLKRFAYSLCQVESDAEDLVAETIVKAFENRNQLRDENKIKQWLFRILNNIFISNYRKNKRQRKTNLSIDSGNAYDSFSLYDQIASSDFTDVATPEKQFIAKITKEKIHQAIDELPEEFRVSLTLCDIDNFSYAEIAAITNVAIGTVRSRIARARKLLQKQLWRYAQELGIRTVQKEKDPACNCSTEELKTSPVI